MGCFHKSFLAAALACGVFVSAPSIAQRGDSPRGAAASSTEMTHGEVRRVDKFSGKLTVSHGAIRSLEMPPMTMAYAVSDSKMLDQVKRGDKVRFRAADNGGKLTITELQVLQ